MSKTCSECASMQNEGYEPGCFSFLAPFRQVIHYLEAGKKIGVDFEKALDAAKQSCKLRQVEDSVPFDCTARTIMFLSSHVLSLCNSSEDIRFIINRLENINEINAYAVRLLIHDLEKRQEIISENNLPKHMLEERNTVIDRLLSRLANSLTDSNIATQETPSTPQAGLDTTQTAPFVDPNRKKQEMTAFRDDNEPDFIIQMRKDEAAAGAAEG